MNNYDHSAMRCATSFMRSLDDKTGVSAGGSKYVLKFSRSTNTLYRSLSVERKY
eukprot:m.875269 g.875269  ORF g.875269 m.875269 type:complete len:54 (-) comp59809_c0_seq1:1065-1226(-)